LPSITSEHVPQMPSRQSWANAIGSSPLREVVVHHVQHLQERHVGIQIRALYSTNCRAARTGLAPDFRSVTEMFLLEEVEATMTEDYRLDE
jgi:hypothetical protein